MEIPLLKDIVVIFGLSIVVLLICTRIRVHSIVGLLLTGIVCGPHLLGLVDAEHEVEMLSEVGIVLLMFTIGLEFSLREIMRIKKLVFLGGGLQVALTTSISALFVLLWDFTIGQAIFYGFLVSLSSTAIILKILQDSAKIATPYGKAILGILIFQDIAVVPMMLMVPFLAGSGEGGELGLLFHLGKGILILAAVLILAQWAVPKLLFQIAKTKNSQLFILSIIFLCAGIAWVSSSVGLSLALGAFLSGLIISESEYSHNAVGHILPFQQVFTSFFFVSIGMLLDVRYIIHHPFLTLFATFMVFSLKFLIASGVAKLMGYSLRNAILVGVGLCQMGEFAFLLSAKGIEFDLISDSTYQLFLTASILSMAISPFIISMGSEIVKMILKWNLPDWLKGESQDITPEIDIDLKDHVVIIGYGVCGRNLSWASKLAGITYAILEINPEIVRSERNNGEPIFYGDASSKAVLEQTNLSHARLVVIAIDDPVAARRIVEVIRSVSSGVYIIVRTRYLEELSPMIELGANDVIPEEFETSVEIFTRVLRKYLIPQDEIEKFVGEVRSQKYQMFRSIFHQQTTFSDIKLSVSDVEVASFRLHEDSSFVGKSLRQSNLRQLYGITVLMIHRGAKVMANPGPDLIFEANDILVTFADHDNLAEFGTHFKAS
ncbi:MAG: CPA2 family monovalent cation:H+ antiporter-2 [Chlamydiales bacterium]|jgi:CPA2 family monovalent cation:H+ antiporter-2